MDVSAVTVRCHVRLHLGSMSQRHHASPKPLGGKTASLVMAAGAARQVVLSGRRHCRAARPRRVRRSSPKFPVALAPPTLSVPFIDDDSRSSDQVHQVMHASAASNLAWRKLVSEYDCCEQPKNSLCPSTLVPIPDRGFGTHLRVVSQECACLARCLRSVAAPWHAARCTPSPAPCWMQTGSKLACPQGRSKLPTPRALPAQGISPIRVDFDQKKICPPAPARVGLGTVVVLTRGSVWHDGRCGIACDDPSGFAGVGESICPGSPLVCVWWLGLHGPFSAALWDAAPRPRSPTGPRAHDGQREARESREAHSGEADERGAAQIAVAQGRVHWTQPQNSVRRGAGAACRARARMAGGTAQDRDAPGYQGSRHHLYLQSPRDLLRDACNHLQRPQPASYTICLQRAKELC